jgi:hypothetical protein
MGKTTNITGISLCFALAIVLLGYNGMASSHRFLDTAVMSRGAGNSEEARTEARAPTTKAKAFALLYAYCGFYWGYNVLNSNTDTAMRCDLLLRTQRKFKIPYFFFFFTRNFEEKHLIFEHQQRAGIQQP